MQATRDASGTTTVTLRFEDWGKAVAVAAPPADQLDPTPGIEQAQVAAFKDTELYMPKAIPAGWKLVRAVVLPAEETKEDCAQVELQYADPASPGRNYLSLYQFPIGCLLPFDGEPFAAGAYRGYGRSSKEEGTLVQITVGATTLQAKTTLSLQELAALLKNLTRLKL